MKLILGVVSIIVLFSSCSHNQLKKELAKRDISLVVVDIDHQLNIDAKEANLGFSIAENLKIKLENEKGITLVKRPKRPTFFEERKLYKKGRGVNYILTGVIDNTSTKKIEYPARQRSEGGTSAGWTEYRACVSGSIKLFKPPFSQSSKSFEFNNICIRQNHKNYKEMLTRTAPKIVKEILFNLEEFLVDDSLK